ncbi:MAG TPA: c-type cytochrome, partial [Anaerolineae bacterium]|nr:c-type cytochrome [Anaerolineae bacterium]
NLMKFRFVIISAITFILSACNFSLAEDVTPPPGYISPTPAPTLGPLYPAQAPSTQNGALIFAEKCAPCHGETGMGDGKQGIQLGVTVPAFGLPEIARPASLAQWYTTVTRGNMERFMPPFASLSDQERWDVVAYAMTLHTSEEQIAKGKQLFEASCANCSTDFFKDQAKMAALSEVELARIIKQGNDQVKPFGKNLSDDDMWAVAAYLRSLSFDTAPIAAAPVSSATPEPLTVTETLVPTQAGTPSTPSAEGTPVGTEQAPATNEATAIVKAGFGNVSGSIENKTDKDLPSDLKVTLRGFDHGADPNTGPQEVFSQEGSVSKDGSFVFENIEMPLNRIFIAELTFEGTDLQSGFAIVKEGDSSVSLPPITLYNKTEDTSKLVVDEARIFFEYGTDGIQVFNAYSFRNPGEEAIIVKLNENGEIPFIKSPAGSSGFGFEPMQDSEKLVQTKDGFEVPPSKGSYGVIAFASMPNAKEFEFSQPFVLPVPNVTVFVPEGVTIKGAPSKDLGVQTMQNFKFQIYQLNSVEAGENLKLTVSGTPKETTASSAPAQTTSNQNLLIGAGALGVILILAGAWMYLRDRNRAEAAGTADDEKDEFGSAEDVMDAIIALDDLHRAEKISDAAYQNRRAELKEILKEKM